MQEDNYTAEDLRYLQEAIASGELKVKHEDRFVHYRDLDEMMRIEQRMKAAINKNANPSTAERKSFRLCVNDGL